MVDKKSNIHDVARESGVSTASVSRTLSSPELVSEKTRKKVHDAIRKTGYRVNRAARNLRTKTTNSIIVLVPNLGNPFFSAILSGIERTLSKEGYNVLFCDTQNDIEGAPRLRDYFEDGRTDGILILDGACPDAELRELEKSEYASRVAFVCEWVPKHSFPVIRSDNEKGATLAAQHLVALGHKHLGHVAGPPENVLTGVRKTGFLDALESSGISTGDEWIYNGDFSLESGVQAAESFLQLQDRPTGLFFASDLMAIGFITRVTDAGLKVPEDVSVIGFDNIEIAGYIRPALTTIRQSRHKLGDLAAQTLLEGLKHTEPSLSPLIKVIDVALVERQSTCPPKK
jgi:LacI family repressor for deo operon, udp, cdd, tsx, nupC, and nupG